MNENALRLRAALDFDPKQVEKNIACGAWNGDTVTSLIDRWVGEKPDAPAIVSDAGSISWSELATRIDGLAAGLEGLGVERGDVVALQMPNVPDFLISYFAICRVGAVMTTIYMPYRQKEYAAILSHSRARVFICPAKIGAFDPVNAVLAMKPDLPHLEAVVSWGGAANGAVDFDALNGGGAPSIAKDQIAASDPFMLLYTSGTTSAPKGVPHPYHTMIGNGRLGIKEHKFGPDERVLSAASFGHLFGLYSVHLALNAGAAITLLPAFTPPDLANTIATLKPSILFAAPAHIHACMGAGLFEGDVLESLRLVIVSGSAFSPTLAEAFAGKLSNGRVSQLWGMTETQAGSYTRPDDEIIVAATTAGHPVPHTELRIVDDEGNLVPAGETGELHVRGPQVFPQYLDNKAANQHAFTADGWFRTGDLAVIDADGRVALSGRSKDVINRGGVKYNPTDVEELLDRHPDIIQSAVIPVPDEKLGERACCVLQVSGKAPTLDEICTYLGENGVTKLMLPERIAIIDQMPLTPTRKVIKGRLPDMIEIIKSC